MLDLSPKVQVIMSIPKSAAKGKSQAAKRTECIMKRLICLLLSCVMLLGLFATTASAAKVTKVQLTMEEPAVGAKRSFKATLPSTASTEVVSVSWQASGGESGFHQGYDYTVTIKVKIKDSSSNTFGASSKINATINGKPAEVVERFDKEIRVRYTWKQLGGAPPIETPESTLKAQVQALVSGYTASNGTTADDLVNHVKAQLPGAEVWNAGGTYALRTKLPTETADGFVATNLGITHNGVTVEPVAVSAPIPALNKSPEQKNLAADKALMQAAVKTVPVTAQTTPETFLASLNAVAKNGTKAAWGKDLTFTPSTADKGGTIFGSLTLTLGNSKDTLSNVVRSLPASGEGAAALLSKDDLAISDVLRNFAAENSSTQDAVLHAAKSAVKNGTAIVPISFSVTPATYDEEGKINFRYDLTLQDAKLERRASLTIPKVRGNMPKDISVNADEWECLRLVNVERYKAGVSLLTMVGPLQDSCDIRAKEIEVTYGSDHLRPDGTNFFTAMAQDFLSGRAAGENIYQNPSERATPAEAMKAWMNSPGHKANILHPDYAYFGAGMHLAGTIHKYWVQNFATDGGVIWAESSTGSLVFPSVDAMERAYLICHGGKYTSYIPFDTDYMHKNGSKYTLSVRGASVVATVVPGFVDVPADSYYAESVAWAVDSGVTTGTSSITFSPAATCTRGQVVTFLWRALGKPEPKTTQNPFADVKASDYFYKPVLWAVENGITNGTGATTFSPNATCTSGQVVTFLYRSNNPGAAKEASNPYYANAVKWAEGKNLLSGTAVAFAPANNAPRSDIVYYLHRNSK